MRVRTCSRCHSVTYCSSECQREDWSIHTSECASLASLYHGAHLHRPWPDLIIHLSYGIAKKSLRYCVLTRLKHDQLRILDTIANMELPSPSTLNRNSKILNFQSDVPMSLFQFFTDGETLQCTLNASVRQGFGEHRIIGGPGPWAEGHGPRAWAIVDGATCSAT